MIPIFGSLPKDFEPLDPLRLLSCFIATGAGFEASFFTISSGAAGTAPLGAPSSGVKEDNLCFFQGTTSSLSSGAVLLTETAGEVLGFLPFFFISAAADDVKGVGTCKGFTC